MCLEFDLESIESVHQFEEKIFTTLGVPITNGRYCHVFGSSVSSHELLWVSSYRPCTCLVRFC